jgi:hypothetical protein
VATNAIASPSATYNSIPVAYATATGVEGGPYKNVTVPINNLIVGNDYVLTFYSA